MKCAYLRVGNVYANRLELEDVRQIGTNEDEYSRTRLVPGDVLIVEGNGSIDQIGRAAIWRGEFADCSHQNHLIKWRSTGEVLPEYALYWLLSPHGRSELVQVAKSSAGLYTLSLSKISAIPISVPPPAEQKEIVRRADELLAFADHLEAHLRRADSRVRTLVPAFLAKAFRGELVPQDPDDEPASELLARTCAARAAEGKTKPKRGGKHMARTKKAPEVAMLYRSDVKADHLSAILKERGVLSAEALWNASQLDIDEFYEQLKEEVAQGLLRERRGEGRDDSRLLEPTA